MLILVPEKAPWPVPRAVQPIVGDSNREYNVSYQGNEPIDEVKERFQEIVGAATFTNFRQNNNGGGYPKDKPVVLDAGDFTIQMKFSLSQALGYGGAMSFVGTSSAAVPDANGAWLLKWETTGQLAFYIATASGIKFILVPFTAASVPINTPHHLEVGRKDGIVYVFFNGLLLGSKLMDGKSNSRGITSPMTTQQSTGFWGSRWDVKIDKGICLHTSTFTPDMAVVPYVRPVYTADVADKIRVQYQFRRDSFENEATRRTMQIRGGTSYVYNGRLWLNQSSSSSGSGYFWQVDPWGQGDFTVECTFNLTSVSATGGAMLMGHWNQGSVTHEDNRWYLIITPSTLKPSFGLARSAVGSDVDTLTLNTSCVTGTYYRVIIERVNGIITMYLLDGLNGDLIEQLSIASTTPLRGNAPHRMASYGGVANWGGAYELRDIRVADKAMYNGAPKLLPVFPAFDNLYTDAEEANIVNQTTLRFSVRDEKTSYVFTPNSAVETIANGVYSQSADTTSRGFSLPPPTPFGAADFTIECRFTLNSGAGYVWGQFDSSGSAANSSWNIAVVASKLRAVFSAAGQYNSGLTILETPTTLTIGREYYVCVERFGATTTLYLDGVAVASTTDVNYQLIDSPLNISRGGNGAIAMNLRDMRISKTSQYKGAVPLIPKFKFFRKCKPSWVMNYVNGYGTLYGYLENSFYTTGVNLSCGNVTHKSFNYNGKIRRLKGLFIDRGGYTIIGWEQTTVDATPDMPIWTDLLWLGGTTYNFAASQPSGFSTPLGGTSAYWSSVTVPVTDGREIPFEFIDVRALIENGVPNTVATKSGTMRTVDGALLLNNTYITGLDSANLALGTADFTIDTEFTVNSITGASGSNIVGLLFWGVSSDPGKAINYEFYYNADSKQFVFSADTAGATTKTFNFDLQLGRKYKVQLTRDTGVLQLWVDDVKIGEYPYTTNLVRAYSAGFNVGRRIGGATGTVSWLCDMAFNKMRIVNVKRSAM